MVLDMKLQRELRRAASRIDNDPWEHPPLEMVAALAKELFGEEGTTLKMSKLFRVNQSTAYRWLSVADDSSSRIPWANWCLMLIWSGYLDADSLNQNR